MAFEKFDPDDPNWKENLDKFRQFFPPQQVDQQIRQAIHFCWMGMPPDKRTVDEVEKQVRRMVDRALRDLREDAELFGFGSD